MVTKVISGGQIGADFAGLIAAKRLGIETGGWIPKGFKTLAGPRPQLGEIYGLVETESPIYSLRTKWNVRDSDGTMRFATNFSTPGEICTYKAVVKYNKPCFDVLIGPNGPRVAQWKALKWLRDNNIKVLNVAGNARAVLQEIVIDYLTAILIADESEGS